MKREDLQENQIPPECCLPMEIEAELSFFYHQIRGEKDDKND